MSPPLQVSKDDWKKIGIGAAMAVAGALLTYVATGIMPMLATKYPEASPFIAALAAIILNISRKYFTDTRPSVPEAAAAMTAARTKIADQSKC
jgi:hypothetical protein